MLPRAARLRRSADFQTTTRAGARAGRPTVVVHAAYLGPRGTQHIRAAGAGEGVRVGFVVSKAVGNAVTRNRVKRRLRHLAAEQIAGTPDGLDVVVRALPPAATAGVELPMDFAAAWTRATHRALGR